MSYDVLNKSEICREYDEAGALARGISLAETSKFQLEEDIRGLLMLEGQAHPPFFVIAQAVIYRLLRMTDVRYDENSTVLAANAFFLFIILMSTYCIGSMIYNRNVGLLAAFLVSFLPMIYGHTRNMLIDFGLTTMTVLSFYLLFKTNKFQSLLYSVLLGIALGFSQLTKEAFISFIFFPLIYYFYISYRTNLKKKVVLNFILTLFFGIAIAGIVYLRPANFLYAFKIYIGKVSFNPDTSKPFEFFFVNSLIYTGTYLAIAAIPLLITYLKNFRTQNKVVFLWISIPLIIFNLSPCKELRFIIPILPAFALVVARQVFSIRPFPWIRRAYVGFLILVMLFQYFVYFFDFRFIDPLFYRRYPVAHFPPILTYRKDKYYPVLSKLVEIFEKEHKEYNENGAILFLFNIGKIHSPLGYKFALEKVPFWSTCPQTADAPEAPVPGTVDWHNDVLGTHYIVDKSGYETEGRGGARENIEGKLKGGFQQYRFLFEKIAAIEVFDGSYIHVYKNHALEALKAKMGYCMSCARPINKTEELGTNSDGSKNREYCYLCFRDGIFTEPDITMKQMIEKTTEFLVMQKKIPEPQAEKIAESYIPKLDRWVSR